MSGDTVLLSRLQFAWTIGYHILWPAYTIGISGIIVILNALWLATKRPVWRELEHRINALLAGISLADLTHDEPELYHIAGAVAGN